MSDLFTAAGLAEDAPHPLADRLRPQRLDEVGWPGSSFRPGWRADAADPRRIARQPHLLGTARNRQDDGGAASRQGGEARLRPDLGDFFRRRRPEESFRGGAQAPRRSGRARCSSWTKSIASTAPSRTGFCPSWRTAPITLIGATTENPSFRTQCRVALPRPRPDLSARSTKRRSRKLLARAEALEGRPLPLDAEGARETLMRMADGDGRAALTLAEEIWRAAAPGRDFRRGRRSPRSSSAARRSTTRRRRGITI